MNIAYLKLECTFKYLVRFKAEQSVDPNRGSQALYKQRGLSYTECSFRTRSSSSLVQFFGGVGPSAWTLDASLNDEFFQHNSFCHCVSLRAAWHTIMHTDIIGARPQRCIAMSSQWRQ